MPKDLTSTIKAKLDSDGIILSGTEIEAIARDFDGRLHLDLGLDQLLKDSKVDETPSFDPAWQK